MRNSGFNCVSLNPAERKLFFVREVNQTVKTENFTLKNVFFFHVLRKMIPYPRLNIEKSSSNCTPQYALRLIPAINSVPNDMVTVAIDQVIEELVKVADRFELDETISEDLDEVFTNSYIKG